MVRVDEWCEEHVDELSSVTCEEVSTESVESAGKGRRFRFLKRKGKEEKLAGEAGEKKGFISRVRRGEFITEGRIGKALDILRIFRAHTSPATTLLVVSFFLLGGGSLNSLLGVGVFLWSILVHWSGYGENSVMDYYGGFDQKDEGKSHFPLVSGRVSLPTAQKIVHTLNVLTAGFIVALALASGGSREVALAFILLAVACGHAYNDGVSKFTTLKFIPLTLFGVFLAAGSYYLSATPYGWVERALQLVPSTLGLAVSRSVRDTLLLLGLGYVAMGGVYQIAWLGELKEIQHPSEVNLLKRIGCRVDDEGTFRAGKARLVGDLSKIAQIVFGFLICTVVNNPVSWVSLGVLAPLAMHFHNETARKRLWNRNETLTYSAVVEVCSLLLFPLMLSPVIGVHASIFIVIFSLLWFMIVNRLLWGTILRPQV